MCCGGRGACNASAAHKPACTHARPQPPRCSSQHLQWQPSPFERQRIVSYVQAAAEQQAAMGFENQARAQALQRELSLRAQPLNEIIGLMGGSQIQMPQFGAYQGQQVAPSPIFGAAQAAGQNAMQQYGIQQAGINAQTSALGNLFGTAAGLYLRSDRRLKSKIVRVGTHPRGFGIYEYDIEGRRERGVMAQEVLPILPHAVRMMPNGYLAVNYGAL